MLDLGKVCLSGQDKEKHGPFFANNSRFQGPYITLPGVGKPITPGETLLFNETLSQPLVMAFMITGVAPF